jgi:serine/threonine-protein kinase
MELERIGKYKILAEIGKGTMGRVYKALDPVLNRHVAIKTLSASLSGSDEVRKRFQREAQAAALLSHPNIVTVHDFGEEQGLIYMAMELLEGQDLRDAIGTGVLGTIEHKLQVMDQICAGLAFAHSKGVVHRDLKPANVHIQPGGQVKIVDFGLAHIVDQEMTQEGIVLGTPNYMSPEQALGDRVDARTDIFSAGVIFYEILTSHRPFDADSTPGVLYQVVHKQPTPVRQWDPNIPTILVDVVEKAMAKDKAQRFQNARQMRAALALAHQALEAGRGPDATLAGESQRALRAAARSETTRTPSPPARPPVAPVEGTVALDVTAPAAARPSDTARPLRTDRLHRKPAAHPPRRGPHVVAAVVGLAIALGAFAVFRPRGPAPGPPASPPATGATEVSALTQALVETQLQLAARDLEDKNYRSAIAQAERVLKLAPGSDEAKRILESARARRDELERAAQEAQRAFEAGQTEAASQALSRVLELDPQHPVAGELTARLNSVFRSRAGSPELYAQALALASEAESLFKRGEFAAATRGYLESRDVFERVRRAARLPAPAAPASPLLASAAPAPSPGPALATPPLPTPEPAAAATPAHVARQFVSGKTLIATARAGGDLEGFETADVRKQRMPELAGRIEFEAAPGTVMAGEPFTVRVYLVNDGKKAVKIKSVALATIVNGTRVPAPVTTPLVREVSPLQRALVTELTGTWPQGVSSWSLEAVITTERDETGTSRLSWM